MKELIDVIEEKTSLEYGWFNRCKLFCKDFRTWKPEVFITINHNEIINATANCNTHINVFFMEKNIFKNEEETKKLEEWKEHLQDGIKKGFLKQII